MLQSVVADNRVAAGVDQQLRGGGAIAPNRDASAAAPRKHDGLVAGNRRIIRGVDQARRSAGAAESSRDDSGLESECAQPCHQPDDQWGFAGSADTQIPDDDDRTAQPHAGN